MKKYAFMQWTLLALITLHGCFRGPVTGSLVADGKFGSNECSGNGMLVETCICFAGFSGEKCLAEDDVSPLQKAIIYKDADKSGALFESANEEEINLALLFASSHDNLKAARLALKRGANPNTSDKDGWTALMWASLRRQIASQRY